ncbi:hypothetical protein BJP34_17985 [Moorena producens PAL-8-15-08-1]|uniref:Uncharacterized protein n=1 Tax=Moorena producens PAL-8-15-08-1 TaxID=1458985 RepID=A0A1D8TTW1_9CYAN|nr:hypothetical protein [Moorena producens]AOX01078.1 hypothetical protein BJP34_17985 [Moorena producens PAL-8-15-08-1]
MTVHESCRIGIGAATRNAPKPATCNLGLWPRYANNLQPWPLATLREQPVTLAFGHATRTTCNLQPATCNLQPATLAFGHATRTTCNLQPATCNLQPWPLATLREQPATCNLQP